MYLKMHCITCKETKDFDVKYIGVAGIGEECLKCGSIFHNRVKYTKGLLMGRFWTDKDSKIIGERKRERVEKRGW